MDTDTCEHCKESIYPDDEKVYFDYGFYHYECAGDLDLPEDDD